MTQVACEIRQARLKDADALFQLVEQFATSYQPQRAAFNAHLPRLLQAPHATVLVAVLGADVVGYVVAFELLTFFANGPVTELQELMVAPAHRQQGIGRLLVEAVMAWARERGSIEVTVPTRRAAAFYQRLGFEETAIYFKLRLAAPQG